MRKSIDQTLFDKTNKYGPIPVHCPEIGNCWIWTGKIAKCGYGQINRMTDGKRSYLYSHRISYEIHNGPIIDNLCVLHKCDNRKCVRPDHLFLGTRNENALDKCSKHRQKFGTKDPNAKLDDDKSFFIKHSNLKQKYLAYMFGVNQSVISRIKNNKCWNHMF